VKVRWLSAVLAGTSMARCALQGKRVQLYAHFDARPAHISVGGGRVACWSQTPLGVLLQVTVWVGAALAPGSRAPPLGETLALQLALPPLPQFVLEPLGGLGA
jgi:hypothetical protein